MLLVLMSAATPLCRRCLASAAYAHDTRAMPRQLYAIAFVAAVYAYDAFDIDFADAAAMRDYAAAAAL